MFFLFGLNYQYGDGHFFGNAYGGGQGEKYLDYRPNGNFTWSYESIKKEYLIRWYKCLDNYTYINTIHNSSTISCYLQNE